MKKLHTFSIIFTIVLMQAFCIVAHAESSAMPLSNGIKAVYAGGGFNIILKDDGTIDTWGNGIIGSPPELTNVKEAACGGDFAVALQSDGTAISWGGRFSSTPRKNIRKVSAGYIHSVALMEDGTITAWGDNYDSECDTPSKYKTPSSIITQTPTSTQTPIQTPMPTQTSIQTPCQTTEVTNTPSIVDDYGDSIETAHDISFGNEINGNFVSDNDIDYFKITPFSSGQYDIYIDESIPCNVCDEKGTILEPLSHFSNSQSFDLQSSNTYYIKISKGYNSSNTYHFAIDLSSDDDFSDSIKGSKELPVNIAVSGRIFNWSDEDVFKIVQSEDFYADFYFDVADNIIYDFMDENGNILVSDKFYSGKSSDFLYKLKGGKTYFLKLKTDIDQSFIKYKVSYKKFAIDFNEITNNAKSLDFGNIISGKIIGEDYFQILKFIPKQSGAYNFLSDNNYNYGASDSHKYIYYIIDSSGEVLDGKYNDYSLTADQSYYLILESPFHIDVSYLINISMLSDDYGNIISNSENLESYSSITGAITYAGDIDTFRINQDIKNDMAVTISCKGYATIKILNNSGDIISVQDIDDCETIEFTKEQLTGKSYYICLSRKYPKVPDDITYKIMTAYIDRNSTDNFQSAKEIKVGQTIVENFSSAYDIDYYKFIPKKTGIYYFADKSGSYLTIDILDRSGNILNNEEGYYSLTADQVYYIKTSQTVSNLLNYSFSINCQIEDDYGNDSDTAHELVLNSTVDGVIDYVGDTDWFIMKAEKAGTYCIEQNSIDNEYPLNSIEVYNSHGDIIPTTRCSLDDINYKYYFNLTENQTCYIKILVYGYVFDKYNYTFKLEGPIPDDCGNSLSSSTTIVLDKTVTGSIEYLSDKDVYSFRTDEKGSYDILMDDNSNLYVKLYDNQGNLIYDDKYQPNKITYNNLSSNTIYYLQISGRSGLTNYKFKISSPIPEDDNTTTDSEVITLNAELKKRIDFVGDKDNFIFTPNASGYYLIMINSELSISTHVTTYGMFPDEVYKSTEPNILLYLKEGISYNIQCEGANNSENGVYSILVNDTPRMKPAYTIKGRVAIDFSEDKADFFSVKRMFKVEIEGSDIYTYTKEDGSFEIADIPENLTGYTIKISKSNFLTRKIKNVVLQSDYTINDPIDMWAGDLVINGENDGSINIKDIIEIAKSFNSKSGDSVYHEWLDLNNDNAINMMDIMIIAKHFNCTTESYTNGVN
ncbi:MAG: dockerin type I domain-containing protein [Bacillota bacterium]|nr:dockerin type I domain-containing protein [Bacillota bacterium]